MTDYDRNLLRLIIILLMAIFAMVLGYGAWIAQLLMEMQV